MTQRKFTVGTRGSALARWQTDHVSSQLQSARQARGLAPVDVDIRVITTQGDVNLADRLAGTLEKGFFTAELEAALRDRSIDWAVHSLKDLPTRLPPDLDVVAVLPRANPADLLVMSAATFSERGKAMLPLVDGAKVGTSSLRRDAMLKTYAPACSSQPLRGNVPTRVEKLRKGQYDAIVLASAGIGRLGLDLSGLRVVELDPRRWQPAPGQGAVAVEGRADDAEVRSIIGVLDDAPTRGAAEAERAFLRVLEGGCTTPFGAYVEGKAAWLGRERDGRWVSIRVPLDGKPVEGVARDARFIDDCLARLARANGPLEMTDDDDVQLWRPL